MLVPVYGSSPTYLNKKQELIKRLILGEIGQAGLEWRSLGQTDYPTEYPLREVLLLAKRCSGGVILGFSQFKAVKGIRKEGTPYQKEVKGNIIFPTEWNNLEAGILFALNVPLLVFREDGISGGIFDNGVTDLFVHNMPDLSSRPSRKALKEVIKKWASKTLNLYYGQK